MRSSNVKGFTLFELLIVVSIIGIVYGVFTQKLNTRKSTEIITLQNFIPWISKQAFKNEASVVCLFDERQKGCQVYFDNKKSNIRLKLFKPHDEVRVFRMGDKDFDRVDFLPLIDKDGISNDVFFRFDILVNGGYKSLVVQKNDTFFFYNSYEKAKKFSSLSDIREYLWEQKKLLNDR